MNLAQLFVQTAERQPDRVALRLGDVPSARHLPGGFNVHPREIVPPTATGER